MPTPVSTPTATKSNISNNYLLANNQLQKAPIYIVSFGAITGPLGTNYQPLASEYSTGFVQSATKTRPRIMDFPSGYSSEFNPVTYQSTLSNLSFDILDNHPQYLGEATKLVTNYVLKNRWVTIKRGFAGLNESDYAVIYMGQINNVMANKNRTGYTFEIYDPRKQLTASILNGHTNLTGNFTVGNTQLFCASTAYFANSTTPSNANSLIQSYLRMGSNLFSYTGISVPGFVSDGTVVWQFVSAGGFIATHPQLTPNSATIPTNPYCANGQNWTAQNNSCGSQLPYASAGMRVGAFFDSGNGAFFTWSGFDSSNYCQWVGNESISIGQVCSNFGNRYICVTPGTTAASGGPSGNGTSTSFTGVALAQPDGQGVSPAVNQAIGATVDNVIRVQGHPIDIMLGLLISTGTGLNNPTNNPPPANIQTFPTSGLANYDVNPGNSGSPGCVFGIGLPWWQVNIPNFLIQKNLMGPLVFVGYFQDQTLALKFIENYILMQAHLAIFTNRNGQVDCRAVLSPADMTGATTLDQTNIVGQPQFTGNLQTGAYFYNETFVKYDYQLVQNYYATIDVVPYVPSLQAFQEVSPIVVDGRMFNTSSSAYGGVALSTRCKNIYLQRFGFPPPLIVCDVFDMMTILNPFDPVTLNHPNVPNYLTGAKGGPIDCQVVKVEPNWSNGTMRVTLMAIGWYQAQSHPQQSVIFSSSVTFTQNTTSQGLVTILPGVLVTVNQGALWTITPS